MAIPGLATGAIGVGSSLPGVDIPGLGDIGDRIGGGLEKIGLGGLTGVDREGTRQGDVLVSDLARAQEAGATVSGPVEIELEFYGPASEKGDSSVRGRIFTDLMDFPGVIDGDDSGRIHNKITAKADAIPRIAQYVEQEGNVKARAIRPNVSAPDRTGGGTGAGGTTGGGAPYGGTIGTGGGTGTGRTDLREDEGMAGGSGSGGGGSSSGVSWYETPTFGVAAVAALTLAAILGLRG